MSASSATERLQAAWLHRGSLACLLWPLACLHRLLLALRRTLYRTNLIRTHRLPVPVVVVGNLIVGGAGKTPTTLALIELLRNRGYTLGVVSRGYGRHGTETRSVQRHSTSAEVGDEPLLLHLRGRVPVVVGRDRVAAGLVLLAQHPEVNLILSDDGLQHWRLARNAQVIVFDERGAGNGWLLPAGPLREPLAPQCPPHSVVVYNAAAPSTPWPGHVAQRSLSGLVLLQDWWQGHAASPDAFKTLRGRTVLAAAGVARPQRFFDMLRAQGLQITELALPDHHNYAALPWPPETPDVVVTEKDAVKLQPSTQPSAASGTRIWVATLDFQLRPAFEETLSRLLAS